MDKYVDTKWLIHVATIRQNIVVQVTFPNQILLSETCKTFHRKVNEIVNHLVHAGKWTAGRILGGCRRILGAEDGGGRELSSFDGKQYSHPINVVRRTVQIFSASHFYLQNL